MPADVPQHIANCQSRFSALVRFTSRIMDATTVAAAALALATSQASMNAVAALVVVVDDSRDAAMLALL